MEVLESLKLVVNELSSQKNNPQSIVGTVSQWFSESGGLHDIVDKFKEHGLGDLVNSWVSHGENLPVSAEQIEKVLGSDVVKNLAAKMGIDPSEVTKHLSDLLPAVVDKMTPEGKLLSRSA
jgi:uncharacterized protein YidB (DUF937 family)